MVFTDVLAEICMSAGPKSVAPVSRPDTVMIADIIRCSMNGRAITMHSGIQWPALTFAMMSSHAVSTLVNLMGFHELFALDPEPDVRANVLHCSAVRPVLSK